MTKKKARAKNNRVISGSKSKRGLIAGALAGLALALCCAGIVASWKPSVHVSNSHALLAPAPPPTPLPLAKEYISAGSKLIATEEPNLPPTVSITSPTSNAVFTAPANITIDATATDADGTISKVEFYQGTTLLNTDTSAPFTYTWPSVGSGTYSLTAKATDNNNAVTTSTAVNVSTTASGNYSLSLNGTTAYAEVANSTSLNITGLITVEAWIKVNTIDGNHHVIVSRVNRNEAGSGGGYELSVNGVGKTRLDLFQSHNTYTTAIGTTVLSTSVWHHVAGVFDGTQMRVYVNGVLDGSLTTTNSPASGTSLLRIGRAAHASNAPPLYLPPFYFAGLIDEVRVTASAIYSSSFTPASSLSSVSGTRGLWKFDNQSPADFSGNNNNCTPFGNASFSTDVPTPPTLNSLSLNGTTAYAEVANSTSLNITGLITVEAWIKVNTIDGNHHVIVSRVNRNEAGSGGGYELSVNGVGKTRLDLFQSHNTYTTAIGTTVLSTSVWHHVAGVFDGTQMRVYVNGVLDGSLTTTNSPASGTSLLRIGRAAHASNAPPLYLPPFYFAGLIDEVRVTASAIYSSSFTPASSLSSVSGTRGLWKFDNQSPADFSGNNNTGSLQGGASYSTNVP